jgi:hypothetical protein
MPDTTRQTWIVRGSVAQADCGRPHLKLDECGRLSGPFGHHVVQVIPDIHGAIPARRNVELSVKLPGHR